MVALNSSLVLPKKIKVALEVSYKLVKVIFLFNFKFKNEQASCFVISLWW